MHGPKGEDVSLGLDILFMLGLKHSLELVLERILSHHWGQASALTATCCQTPPTLLHVTPNPLQPLTLTLEDSQ